MWARASRRRVTHDRPEAGPDASAAPRLHWPSCKERSRERPLRKARLRKRGLFLGGRSRPGDAAPFLTRSSRPER